MGILSIDIEPIVGYLDFIGPAKEPNTTTTTPDNNNNSSSKILKGNIILKLDKAVKVKTMTVKFKGQSQVNHYVKLSDHQPQHAISSPLLPKLKTKVLSKSSIFPGGDHTIPWELEIPNIYPRSFSASKRGSVQYKVELKITLGINKKPVTADHPIVIRRHLIPSQELATLVRINTFEYTTNKFHYQVEAPSMICVEHGYLPISIKYNRPVRFIYTQLVQVEVYRCRSISKVEADMAILASKYNSTVFGGQTYESYKNGDAGLSKLLKRIQPVTLYSIDPEIDNLPLLLLHDLDYNYSSLLTPSIESPLVAIYHQLEVTFNFGHEHDEIRAKIPVLVSSVPDSIIKKATTKKEDSKVKATTKQKYLMETQLHRLPMSIETIDTTIQCNKQKISNRCTMDESTINTIKDGLLSLDQDEKSIKKSLSDQNLQLLPTIKKIPTNTSSSGENNSNTKRSNHFSPPSAAPFFTIRPHIIDVQLANATKHESTATAKSSNSISVKSSFTPNRQTFVERPLILTRAESTISTATTIKNDDLVIDPPTETFAGLLPPPRRARKKEPTVMDDTMSICSNSSSNGNSNRMCMTTSRPLPTHSSSSSSIKSECRPTSPISIHVTAKSHHVDSIMATPPLSPRPKTPNIMLRLNQSKSTCTNNGGIYDIPQTVSPNIKRSNSTTTTSSLSSTAQQEDYSNLITSHYFCAELPPIPPAITRQKLPSIPMVDKEEHRKTKMYYEDESDDDEEENDDITIDYKLFLLQQQQQGYIL